MFKPIVIWVLLAFAGCGLAVAQTAEGPVMGSSGSVAPAPDDSAQVSHILVVGDAIGGGLGAGMSRMVDAAGGFDVTIRFNEESGLARPEVYDWVATVPKILANADFDVIVVMMGSNDRQQTRDGNMRHAFNSPEWITAYKAQIDRLLDELLDSGARVYWVGMPPMQAADYDAAIQVITALQKERAEARGVTFIDMRPHFSAADGSYTDTGPDDTGVVRRLRGRDGISFFKQGNNRMGQIVLAAIMSGGAAPAARPLAEMDAVETPKAPEIVVPEFGRAGQFGEVFTLVPKDVSATVTLIALGHSGEALAPAAAIAALQAVARQGSSAAAVFAGGLPAAAPAGRVDDVRLTPPAP